MVSSNVGPMLAFHENRIPVSRDKCSLPSSFWPSFINQEDHFIKNTKEVNRILFFVKH